MAFGGGLEGRLLAEPRIPHHICEPVFRPEGYLAEPTSFYPQTACGRLGPVSSVSPRRSKEKTALAVFGVVAAAIWTATPLAAQDDTGAAIDGHVLGVHGTPLEQAIVQVVNSSNGERWQTTTNARGRYFIEYLSVGGPYRIEVRAVGYQPALRVLIRLALGQRLTADFALTPAVLQIPEITVTGTDDPRFSAARTGPAQIISDSTIARLPVDRRDYTELALLSPQVTKSPNGGLSFAGQHDRFNSIQIDGTNNNDPFGKSGSGNGTPGWAVGLTAFLPEAVKELQVVSAPFDVRYGSFAGGLINAVTKSGSNQVEGSILGHFESSDLVGTDATGSPGSEFSRKELGLTLGAPIVRDRVALFVNADLRQEAIPQSVPAPSSDTTGGADSAGVGIRYGTLVRFQDLLRSYGVQPGSFQAGAFRAPTRNLFAKVTAQLGVGSRLAVSHNYGHGNARDETGGRDRGFYALSSAGTENPETINATRLAWTRNFAPGFSNKLILARVDDRRTCLPNSSFPAVSLIADESELFAGGAGFCLGLEAGHTMWEITDNFGMLAGNHRLTFGIHGERIDMVDDVLAFPGGVWFFRNLDSLERGVASGYTRDFSTAADSQVAFRVNQIGFYVQDQWLPTSRLTLTAGVRLDVPFVPTAPAQHQAALNELGINTALTPSGNVLWSPRLGVNYDPSGRGTAVLRGGAGFFAGHPAYVWFRNVYGTTGIRALRLECGDDAVPAFTLDPGNQPTECAEPSPQPFPLAYFDPDFRYPRSLKVALGADQLLPGGIVGTLDFLYTLGVNIVQMVDVNLAGPIGASAGEGGRVLYGTIEESTGRAMPARRTDALRGVFQMRNGSGDRSYSITAQLEKRFPNGTEVSGAYTYTNAKDRMSMGLDLGGLNAGSASVDGTLEHREVRTSFWERPHKITLVGTTDLPLGFSFGLIYVGMSGAPYTYVLLGDPNADGFRPFSDLSNDAVYVPRDAGDITLADPADFAALDRLIRDEPCLRNQRGGLLQRNSCRDPWVHETSACLSKQFRLADRRILEVTADLFNVLSFLDSDWGRVRQTPADAGNVALMELVGYDAPNGRGVYGLVPVYRREIDVEASRWRLQLGATLHF
jgi:carboxypeptidase family protein